MLLADMGADVIRVDRARTTSGCLRSELPFLTQPPSVEVDLKTPEGIEVVLRLIERADGVIEGSAPASPSGSASAPTSASRAIPKLVYGRMTGWGQTGPLASAGHDINYIALTGALQAIGGGQAGAAAQPGRRLRRRRHAARLRHGVRPAERALRQGPGHRRRHGRRRGAAAGRHLWHGGAGIWNDDERETNMLDGGAHFYDTYECTDGKFVSVGLIEPQFYDLLLEKTGLKGGACRPRRTARLGAAQEPAGRVFKTKTRDEWCAIMEGTDVCFAPVLTMEEAPQHPHAKARGAYVEVQGFPQPAPAPRFSRTKEGIAGAAARRGQHTDEVLAEKGFSTNELGELKARRGRGLHPVALPATMVRAFELAVRQLGDPRLRAVIWGRRR